jgi:hypothetical protein
VAICRSPSSLFFGCGMNGTDCGIKSLCVKGLESVAVGGIKNRVVVSQEREYGCSKSGGSQKTMELAALLLLLL